MTSARWTTASRSAGGHSASRSGRSRRPGVDVRQLEQLPRQLEGGHAQQRLRADGCQRELDAGLVALVVDLGRPRVQARDRRPAFRAGLRHATPAHLQRLSDGQHEGQRHRRQASVYAGRAQVDVVGHQRGDVRRQRGCDRCHGSHGTTRKGDGGVVRPRCLPPACRTIECLPPHSSRSSRITTTPSRCSAAPARSTSRRSGCSANGSRPCSSTAPHTWCSTWTR